MLPAATLLLAFACALFANEEPPLPTWDRGPVGAPNLQPGSQFSNLLPEDNGTEAGTGFYLGVPGMLKSPPLLMDDSGPNPHDLSLFLRGGLLNTAPESAKPNPTPTLALREVPVTVLDLLKQVPLNEYLINPQSLVTEVPALDIERLLQFHASESRIRLYILVLDRDQKLSSTAVLNPLIARLRSERELCLAIYPLGEPWRARFMVSPAISQSSSMASMTEMAEDCIEDSMQVNEAEQQLQRFAVRLSTRLFWLEKSLPVAAVPLHSPAADKPTVLHEVATKTAPLAPAVVSGHANVLWAVLLSVLCVLTLSGLFYGLRFWLRFRAARKVPHVWTLPEAEVMPRLGGAFSGGAGAMVHYGGRVSPTAK